MRFWAALWTALLLPLAAPAETAIALQTDRIRIATFNTELSRKGPGLLLRDLLRQKDPQIAAVTETITAADPDILLLQGMDWDLNSATLNAFADLLAETIAPYPHRFAPLARETTISLGVARFSQFAIAIHIKPRCETVVGAGGKTMRIRGDGLCQEVGKGV